MRDIQSTVDWLLNGVDDVVSRELLEAKLERSQRTQTPLIVKLGVDPTAPDIHLGHTVVLEKLRQFQELGHQVVFLIGDMTGRIGDPTGRSETRRQLSKEDVQKFAETYVAQAGKVLDRDRLILRYNSEWLEPLRLAELIDLMSRVTLARILERDDFHDRFSQHFPIHLHELLYPLMQAYDSVALKADVELGGTDQRFNILTARQIQEAYGQEPEVGLFMPILEGTDGVRKMSKSLGNYVGVEEPPDEIFGKVMSIPDSLMVRWYQLLLGERPETIQQRLAAHENPRDIKAELARRLVSRFWGEEWGRRAQENFDRTFRAREVPDDAPLLSWRSEWAQIGAIDLVAGLPGVPSRQEARRLLTQGAVTVDGQRVSLTDTVSLQPGSWIKVGKRRFFRVQELETESR
ncbi:MAG: tyrosine--tRNA ligase [Firmicutes bacterium]|nr:tyrosine--tRNA ligase [Bacillota bacterium]